MSKFNISSKIIFFMNLLIIYVFIQSSGIIGSLAYELLYEPENIDILRLDIPWNHPIDEVTIMLDQDTLEKNPELLKAMNKNLLAYNLLKRFLFLTLVLFILYQIKKLITAIQGKTFFQPENIMIIKNLSILVGLWALSYFILYQLITVFIPIELITERINLITFNEHPLHNLISAINFEMIFIGIVLYAIAVTFREGYKLKEQTDLTI